MGSSDKEHAEPPRGLASKIPDTTVRIKISEERRDQLEGRLNPIAMKRHEWWRLSYMRDRYAQKLTGGELDQRTRDIVINALCLTAEAKVGLPPMDAGGSHWMELLSHMLEEINQRRGFDAGLSPEIFRTEPIPDFSSELAKKAAAALAKQRLAANQAYIKYGKREYMTSLYSEGAVRLQPASYFSHPSHLGAVRDDELALPVCLSLTREDMNEIALNVDVLPAGARLFRADVDLRFEKDYWLYCMTTSVDPRLFVDFHADSCVIVRDRDAFRERLRAAAASALPACTTLDGSARYVDPLLPETGKIFIPMTKHFRYSYQQEFRFAWIPEDRPPQLAAVDISIGSLKEMSELIVL